MKAPAFQSRSIRFWLTLWYSIVLVLGLALFGSFVWIAMRYRIFAEIDTELWNRSRGVADYLRIEESENPTALAQEIGEIASSLPPGCEMQVTGPDGDRLFASTNARSLFKPLESSTASPVKWETSEWGGGIYRIVDQRLKLRGRGYRLLIGVSTGAARHTLKQLGLLLLGAIPGVVLIAALGGYLLSTRALSRIDDITRTARRMGIENLAERLTVPRADDEVQRLTKAWNEMLARLEAAVTRISQFTSDASHELRTPIAFIRSTAEIALRRPRTELQYRDSLERIEMESERMTQLIGDLLFLARGDARALPHEMVALDLRQPLRTAYREIEPLASSKEIRLTLQEPLVEIPVIGNESALRRMLLALLENAVKYTPPGGAIAVSAQESAQEARLIVRDTGIGVPAAALAHIFERFFRADFSRSRESGGYGLGLSIAQTIARQHQGSIEAHSEEGAGSSFSVTMPLAKAVCEIESYSV